jgi:hypothetical protein
MKGQALYAKNGWKKVLEEEGLGKVLRWRATDGGEDTVVVVAEPSAEDHNGA